MQAGRPEDIVLRPANDYVAEFTQDVPRVKVITVGECMTLGPVPGGVGGEISVSLTLEQVLPQFARGIGALACIDETGSVRGHVTPAAILSALAAEEERVS